MGNAIRFGIYNTLCLIFLLCNTNLFGQLNEDYLDYHPGFVLVSGGDSISCFIKHYDENEAYNNYNILNAVNEEGETVSFENKVTLLNKGNSIFVVNPYEDETMGNPRFMKLMNDGYLKLFKVEGWDKEEEETTEEFIVEVNDKVFLLSDKRYVEQLDDILGGKYSDLLDKYRYGQLPLLAKRINANEYEEGKYTRYKNVKDQDALNYIIPEMTIRTDLSDKIKARDEIVYLYEGALVVRLKTNERKIAAYDKAGMDDMVRKLEMERDVDNKSIILSFTNSFNFCPVFFIYANDYGKVINSISSGYFVNENLEIDSAIQFRHNNFFFCDRGPAYSATISGSGDAKIKQVSSTPMIQDAFVIKNKELVQLVDPFPFAVPIRLDDFDKSVGKLNNSLTKFYGR